jgi:excisionase family DNA binding protein
MITNSEKEDFQLMNIQETAEYLHIPLNTLYKKYHVIPHLKIGSRILFCKKRMNEWLEEQMRVNRN